MKIDDVNFGIEAIILRMVKDKKQVYTSVEVSRKLNIPRKLVHYYLAKNDIDSYRINNKIIYYGSKEAIGTLRLRHEKLINESIKKMEE